MAKQPDNELVRMLMGGTEFESSARSKQPILKPPFNYAGSKFRSVREIVPRLPYTDVFVEAFGGSGAVLLNREPSILEVFNDVHAGVTAFYRCMRDHAKLTKLLEWLEVTVHSREEFVWCRDHWRDPTNDVERAARWYYSVVSSFASLGRNFGRALGPKSIMGGRIRDRIPSFRRIHARFRKVTVENQDWRPILKDFNSKETVAYLDPPYLPTEVARGTYAGELTIDEHRELLAAIGDFKGFVALSGYPNALYDSMPYWDEMHTWKAFVSVKAASDNNPSNIWGDKRKDMSGRSNATEKLWIKQST
jgi:DNA adenine methylase